MDMATVHSKAKNQGHGKIAFPKNSVMGKVCKDTLAKAPDRGASTLVTKEHAWCGHVGHSKTPFGGE